MKHSISRLLPPAAVAVAVWILSGQPVGAQTNLLANPDFDVDLSGWGVTSSSEAEAEWSGRDAQGDSHSGSMRARNMARTDFRSTFIASQCVTVDPGESYTFGGSVYAPEQQTFRGVFFQMLFLPNPSCGGGSIEVEAANTGSRITGDWVQAKGKTVAPAGAMSAIFRFAIPRATADPADDVEVFVDGLFVIEGADVCVPNVNQACITDRFQVIVDYHTSLGEGESGRAVAVSLDSLGFDRGALFWFFSPDNPEVLFKILDGCGINGYYWVFYSAGTDVGFDIEVVEASTGEVWRSTNPEGRL
ncbi:MAG: carbohydrate binding domain-containing protein, partial [Halobacteriales archaeon]|nr:carbohydrate binding domain-containing protein [Halobacteriales archaeon]